MSSDTQRKHRTLNLRKKMELLERLDKGESPSKLAKEYEIGRATLFDIKKKKLKIMEHIEVMERGEEKRRTLKGGVYPEMETALFKWYLKERAKKKFVSGEMLKSKAREIYKKLTKKEDFRASAGWLDKFKNRFGIRLLSTPDDQFSKSIYAVQQLVQDKIDKLGLTQDQVFNANESGLFWQVLPKKTFASTGEESVPSKEKIIFMPCANASGKHKLNLMVIGNSEIPTAFKNVSLPVYYTNQPEACITRGVITQWFYDEFVPGVRALMRKSNLPEKALLILDNSYGNIKAEDLKSSDGNIQTMILPPNNSTSLQPMLNVIPMVTIRYKKKLLLDVIAQGGDISQNLKDINLKNVVFCLADSWNSIPATTIKSSWEKLWPFTCENKEERVNDEKEDDNGKDDMPVSTFLKIFADRHFKINHKQLTTWLENNAEDTEQVTLYQELCHEDLLEVIIEEEEPAESAESSQCETSVTCDEALFCFNKCITWAEENGVSAEETMVLRNLREKAFKQGLMAVMPKFATE